MNPLFVLMIAAALQPKTIIPLRWYMFSIQEVDMHQYGALFWCRFAASLAGLPSNIPLPSRKLPCVALGNISTRQIFMGQATL